jgi:hypothetical protein
VLTDNGAVFTGKQRGQGRVVLEVQLGLRRVRVSHSRPCHPQTCGKVERFHQTLKKWLAAQPPAATIAKLQRQLNRLCRYYNTVRPHRALGRRTPAQAYAARPKAVPSGPARREARDGARSLRNVHECACDLGEDREPSVPPVHQEFGISRTYKPGVDAGAHADLP